LAVDPDGLDLDGLAGVGEAVERLGESFGMFLQAVTAASVFAAMTLETHINCVAAAELTGQLLESFDRLSHESKCSFCPVFLEGMRSIRARNRSKTLERWYNDEIGSCIQETATGSCPYLVEP